MLGKFSVKMGLGGSECDLSLRWSRARGEKGGRRGTGVWVSSSVVVRLRELILSLRSTAGFNSLSSGIARSFEGE